MEQYSNVYAPVAWAEMSAVANSAFAKAGMRTCTSHKEAERYP